MSNPIATKILRAWVAAAALGAPACAWDASDTDRSPQNTEETVDSDLRAGHPGKIDFAPCPEDPSLECGTLAVPVDHQKPWGEKVDLAVVRARATGPGKRIGVLMANPGGPGASGVSFVIGGLALGFPAVDALRERFDIVSFDPRGVARSRPVVCQLQPTPLPPRDASDAELAPIFEGFGQRLANACLAANGLYLTSLTTNNVARDMDMLRRALGEPQITYVGLSYGSELGAVYATLFPGRVRAMVLDGGFPAEFDDYLTEFSLEQQAGFEMAFRRLDVACRETPGCPLAGAGAVAAFDSLAARLAAQPVEAGGIMLTDSVLRNVVAELLYFENPGWPLIVGAVASASAGDYTLLSQLALGLRTFVPGNEVTSPALLATDFGPVSAYICNDHGSRRAPAEYLRVDATSAALYPRFFGRFYMATELARCASWPAADPPIIGNVRGRVHTPIVLIGNEFDNATPLAWSRRLARTLGMDSSLIRYQGGGHTAYLTRRHACIDAVVNEYVINRVVPPEGTSCPPDPIPFGPPAAVASTRGQLVRP